MKKALVLGASGGMGFALVEELVSRNIPTIAFARSQKKLEEFKYEWGPLAEIYAGDVMNSSHLKEAISKADYVFHSLNIPYEKWDPTLFTMLQNILNECQNQNKPFIYVDNIYAYGRQARKVTEEAEKNPHTKKGKFRLKLQKEIEQSGVPYIIAHFPDFYGPKAESTLLQYTFEQCLKKNSAGFVGYTTIQKEFIYTKDGAKALVELALRDYTYNQTWNIAGAGTITGEEVVKIASKHLNKDIKVIPIHKWMIRLLGIFNPSMKEVVEMMYLNEVPVILDSSKYEREVGPLPKTPYEIGIVENLHELSKESLVEV
ncbi:SDR family NAD(P)-dependent oxidoreductase [Cytobacillus sp. FJAT-54145]|uniref:SDR family NAD(P)-dependent oxidoreductase n=1 Tax=Cytobacillus spartinae TaxID=3299023 RepID=A0ABW6KB32_9BACI